MREKWTSLDGTSLIEITFDDYYIHIQHNISNTYMYRYLV